MPKQKGELRIAVQRAADFGLFWQATLEGEDLYAGTSKGGVGQIQMSYHASGAMHLHVFNRRGRIVGPPSQPLRSLAGGEKVGGWGLQLADVQWGYRPKCGAVHRRTLILQEPVPVPLTVDLWVLQPGQTELVERVLKDYGQVKIIEQLHVVATRPELLAVVWTFTEEVLASMISALRDSHSGKREKGV